MLTHYREITLVIQGKRNHNICDVRLDYGAEVLEDYRVGVAHVLHGRFPRRSNNIGGGSVADRFNTRGERLLIMVLTAHFKTG